MRPIVKATLCAVLFLAMGLLFAAGCDLIQHAADNSGALIGLELCGAGLVAFMSLACVISTPSKRRA